MKKLKNLPIGIQNFESLINDGYLYVDKTALMYELVTTGRYYFLSRPRRFGKSLLISTLHSYFDGKKELFDGLAVSKLEQKWEKYPVLHFYLSSLQSTDQKSFDDDLVSKIRKYENIYCKNIAETDISKRFENVIKCAYEKTKSKVVILIDEYEKPLLQAINNPEMQNYYSRILKSIYSAIESQKDNIQFAMIIGTTKYGLNNIISESTIFTDISLNKKFNSLCGFTENDIKNHLVEYLVKYAVQNNQTENKSFEELRQTYAGYKFNADAEEVFNPANLLLGLYNKSASHFWCENGRPTYLFEFCRKRPIDPFSLWDLEVSEKSLIQIDIKSNNLLPVLFQSGYLTLESFDEKKHTYKLKVPNTEVKSALNLLLKDHYENFTKTNCNIELQNFTSALDEGNVAWCIKELKAYINEMPYELYDAKNTKDYLKTLYKKTLYAFSKRLTNFMISDCYLTDNIIKLILHTTKLSYVMAFNLNGTAEEALAQINSKDYALPFAPDKKRKLIKIGLNFNNDIRNIEKWIIEE